jgi:hypothetical protein
MSGYRPQVGDLVKRPHWTDDAAETVTAVGAERFLGVNQLRGYEESWLMDDEWIKREPKPEIEDRWLNWYATGPIERRSRKEADHYAGDLRLFVVHVGMRDGDYFAEIEPA